MDARIRDLYLHHAMGSTRIARATGIPRSTVIKVIQQLGIARSRSNAQCARFGLSLTREMLAESVSNSLSLQQMADRFGVSRKAVRGALRRFGIAREPHKSQPIFDAATVEKLYAGGLTGQEIAERLKCGRSTVYATLDRTGVDRRDLAGENHPNWKGGVSSKWDKLHQNPAYKMWQLSIFKRDRYQCMLCRVKGRDLHAHHIHPKYLAPDRIFDPTNGVTVCQECHNKLINGFEKDLIRLFRAVVKVNRTVSERVCKIIFKNKFEIQPRKCGCGCGKFTRIIGREPNEFIRGHAPRIQEVTEVTRQKIADAQRFDDGLIARAQELYNTGLSTTAVAEKLEVSKGWVHKVVESRGRAEAQKLRFQDPAQRKRPRKELPIDQILADYNGGRGLNPETLAVKYGASHITIRSRLREAGIYPPAGHEKFIHRTKK